MTQSEVTPAEVAALRQRVETLEAIVKMLAVQRPQPSTVNGDVDMSAYRTRPSDVLGLLS